MRMPLLASASAELDSARGCAVGGAAGMGAVSMPIVPLAQKVMLNEPVNAGSTRVRSAMFANAVSSSLYAFALSRSMHGQSGQFRHG
jgi:hypothetical protein